MTQTAGLAVTYFDRYLSKMEVGLVKQRVQLMALTCTLIAAKFSETKMPSLGDLCELAHGLFTKAQLKETELETLRVLQWELHTVTPHAALEQLAVITNHTDDQSKTFLEHAEFFIDMSYYMVRSPPLLNYLRLLDSPVRKPPPLPPPSAPACYTMASPALLPLPAPRAGCPEAILHPFPALGTDTLFPSPSLSPSHPHPTQCRAV